MPRWLETKHIGKRHGDLGKRILRVETPLAFKGTIGCSDVEAFFGSSGYDLAWTLTANMPVSRFGGRHWGTATHGCSQYWVFMYTSLGSAYGSQPVMDLLWARIDRDQYTRAGISWRMTRIGGPNSPIRDWNATGTGSHHASNP